MQSWNSGIHTHSLLLADVLGVAPSADHRVQGQPTGSDEQQAEESSKQGDVQLGAGAILNDEADIGLDRQDRADHDWLSDQEQRMWRGFQLMWRNLDRAVERDLMEGAALSSADFTVLVPLSEAPDRRLRARDLGHFLDWDRSRLSHQIRRMEQRELLTRSSCPTDARGTFIELTDHGWTLLQQAAPGHVHAVRANFFDVLTKADVVALEDISRRVNDRIESLNLDGSPGAKAATGAATP